MSHEWEKSTDNGQFVTADNIIPQKAVVRQKVGGLLLSADFCGTTFNMFQLCRPISVESYCMIGWQQVPRQRVNNVTVVINSVN